MRTLMSLMIGLLLGAAIGATLALLFAPTSGEQLVKDVKRGFSETMEEARKASEQRRAELEAELAKMRSQ